jgi:hypothetical protein
VTELGSLEKVSAMSLLFVNDRCTYITVDGSDYNGADHHDPIRERNVNLTVEGGASISRLDLWEVGRMHELYEQLESASDESLRSNNSGQDRKDKRWIEHARRYSFEERIRVCRWSA